MSKLRDGAGHLDTGRSGAADKECQQFPLQYRTFGCFGFFKGIENAASNAGGIRDRLQPRREDRPFLVTEVSVRRTGREDKHIVRNCATIGDHLAGRGINRSNGAAQHPHSRIIAERGAQTGVVMSAGERAAVAT